MHSVSANAQVHRRGTALTDGEARVHMARGPRFRLGGSEIGKDARCSDAVFALCLATRPDVFLNWFTPKGYPPHVRGFPKEPLLPCLIRRSSMTRCTRDQLPVRICSEKPIRTCCCPQTFAFRFSVRRLPSNSLRSLGAFAYRWGF